MIGPSRGISRKVFQIRVKSQAVWYAFGLVHFVALSAFFPGPTGSADRVNKKKLLINSLCFSPKPNNEEGFSFLFESISVT